MVEERVRSLFWPVVYVIRLASVERDGSICLEWSYGWRVWYRNLFDGVGYGYLDPIVKHSDIGVQFGSKKGEVIVTE